MQNLPAYILDPNQDESIGERFLRTKVNALMFGWRTELLSSIVSVTLGMAVSQLTTRVFGGPLWIDFPANVAVDFGWSFAQHRLQQRKAIEEVIARYEYVIRRLKEENLQLKLARHDEDNPLGLPEYIEWNLTRLPVPGTIQSISSAHLSDHRRYNLIRDTSILRDLDPWFEQTVLTPSVFQTTSASPILDIPLVSLQQENTFTFKPDRLAVDYPTYFASLSQTEWDRFNRQQTFTVAADHFACTGEENQEPAYDYIRIAEFFETRSGFQPASFQTLTRASIQETVKNTLSNVHSWISENKQALIISLFVLITLGIGSAIIVMNVFTH